MAKLWQGDGQGADAIVAAYTSADDAVLDNLIVDEDLCVNAAHARMLAARGYLSPADCAAIVAELARLRTAHDAGGFSMHPDDEDVHTRVENEITAALGEPGKRLHTGRSRNDQVLADLRLWQKRALYALALAAAETATVALEAALAHAAVPMPGYTHSQRAMPSSVGLWLGALADALAFDARHALAVAELADACPLGSGAGYGITLRIDRPLAARLLGFSRVQTNPVWCQNSRGKVEGLAAGACAGVMASLGRFAADMLLYTTGEFAFLRVPDGLTTGSSIMPQKRNLDAMELMRGRARTVLGYEQIVKSVAASLQSGYSRDMQEMKRPLFDAFRAARESLAVAVPFLRGLVPDPARLAAAMTPDLYATDEAFRRVEAGTPFRDAYRQVKAELASLPPVAAAVTLDPAATPGTPANPAFAETAAAVADARDAAARHAAALETTLDKLFDPLDAA